MFFLVRWAFLIIANPNLQSIFSSLFQFLFYFYLIFFYFYITLNNDGKKTKIKKAARGKNSKNLNSF